MQWENLYYALTQLIHNFGALAVVGGALAGFKIGPDSLDLKRKFAFIVLAGWGAQAISGLFFGAISLYFYGETPDLHSTAYVAFVLKLLCALSGTVLALIYIKHAKHWQNAGRQRAWLGLTGLGVTALTAAAFLRWFS